MRPPIFSVIIPTYNRELFISQTINSVLTQDYQDFEVIVVDDGSTDGTERVVKAIQDPRVKYLSQENRERAAARNLGTVHATGDFVTYLDSDDVLYSGHLAAAEEVLRRHTRPEIFHLGYEIESPNGDWSMKIDDLPPTANDRLIQGNSLSCRGVFVRRDIATRFPFNEDRELSGSEDYELWLRLASRYPIYCDNAITSAIIQHDQRSVITTNRAKLDRRIELLEKYLMEDPEFVKRFGSDLGRFKANNRIYIALHIALGREKRVTALTYLGKAIACSPAALRNRAFYGTIKRLFY